MSADSTDSVKLPDASALRFLVAEARDMFARGDFEARDDQRERLRRFRDAADEILCGVTADGQPPGTDSASLRWRAVNALVTAQAEDERLHQFDAGALLVALYELHAAVRAAESVQSP